MRAIVAATSALILVAALTAVLQRPAAAAVASADTVSVTGSGIATGTPDTALVSAGVESSASTARAALAANAASMARVIAALRAAGARNVTTQTVSLQPRTGPRGRPNGFIATNVVSASIALDRAGALIDAAVEAGANIVYGPSLTTSGAKRLYRQALRAAVADARERAVTLASAAGRALGRILSLSETANGGVPAYAKAGAVADSTPLVAGEQEITASVTVTFRLR